MTTTPKGVRTVKQAPPMHWVGDGFPVQTMFSYADAAEEMSPFLLLDYAAPATFPPSEEPRGVGAHPHRGFETVTLVYRGEIEHRDSAGHGGRIGPGDVQWMTAGSGVVHEEKFGRSFAEAGGEIEMVQLWVNLPRAKKMSAPAYQDLEAKRIPSVALPRGAGTVRVVAGSFGGSRGPARTFTPVDVWDVSLRKGGLLETDVAPGRTAALLLLHGGAEVNGVLSLAERELAVLDRRGEGVRLEATADARLLFLSGEPIPEPVVGYGPFVMNSEEEIRQAIADFRAGRMGGLPDR
jgi:redox-sensitive bicupin YhaK (pirin superfamily)